MPPDRHPRLPHMLWRYKGTILVQAVIITVGLLTRHQSASSHQCLVESFGFDYGLLRDGQFWHLLTGTWIQSTPGIELSMIALVLSGTIFLEHQAGSGRMLVTAIVGDWTATVLTALSLRVLAGLGSASAMAHLYRADSGSSALAHAGLAAAAMLLPPRIRALAVPALVIFTVGQFSFESLAPALAHVWAVLAGSLMGWLILRRESKSGDDCEDA